MMKILIAAGADVNAAADDGGTTLLLAAELGNPEMANLLLAAGARVNATRHSDGETVLMGAVRKPDPELEANGATLEKKLEVMRALIAAGAHGMW